MTLRNPRRISIVGSTGSGKTYLARRVAAKLGLPLHELDELKQRSARSDAPDEAFVDMVRAIVAQDEWIIDGHYREVRDLIWGRADIALWLNYPTLLIVNRLLRRFAAKRIHQVDRSALAQSSAAAPSASWAKRFGRLARTLRERREYGELLRSPEYRSAAVVELRSSEAAEEWLKCIER